ncbi:MAG: glycerol-3-phosphate acyltransferase [Lachnospiraceae bacterium]|nr:glycerol-3-phosphate acyltransferase [Lachnospiraceae bacterium]
MGINMYHVICLLIGYVCGCFLTAVVVVRLMAHEDVFQVGSGNPGMANVMHRVGKKAGFLVLAGDVIKTLIAFGISYIVARDHLGLGTILAMAGLGTVLGHNYPIWHKFKGGKGVTVTVAYMVVSLIPWGAIIGIAVGIFAIVTGDLWTAAILAPVIAIPFAFWQQGTMGGIVMIILAVIMIIKNIDGTIKVLKGEEYRRFKKKSDKDE